MAPRDSVSLMRSLEFLGAVGVRYKRRFAGSTARTPPPPPPYPGRERQGEAPGGPLGWHYHFCLAGGVFLPAAQNVVVQCLGSPFRPTLAFSRVIVVLSSIYSPAF